MPTPTKRCFKCHEVKELTNFYRHSMMADGRLNKCKECTKRDVKEHYQRTWDERQAYEKRRAQTPQRQKKQREYSRKRYELHPEEVRAARRRYAEQNKDRVRAARRRYFEQNKDRVREQRRKSSNRYPEKKKARQMVSNAVRDGKLKRLPCEVCGGKAQAHHDDYSRPLEVRWLCSAHHGEQHRRD